MGYKHRDIRWAAGIFEGEGTTYRALTRRTYYPRITVATTDKDVAEEFGRIVGCGHLHGPYQREGVRKPNYQYDITKRLDVVRTLKRFRPYLLSRRLKQVDAVLTAEGEVV